MKTSWLIWLALGLAALILFRQRKSVSVGNVSTTVTQDGGTKEALSSFVGNATDFLSAQTILKDLAKNAKLKGCDENGCKLLVPYRPTEHQPFSYFETPYVPQSLVDTYGILP